MILAVLLQVAVPPLDGIEALSVGVWVRPLRRGEHHFLWRGEVQTAPSGDRLFKPREDLVTFLLGTDERGFFMGAVHGNGRMPFPFVTLNEVPTHAWSRLVAVKDVRGFQHFYMNGALAWSDVEAAAGGVIRPFKDAGGPARTHGEVDDVLILPRALTAEEVRADYERDRRGSTPGTSIALRPEGKSPAPLWESKVLSSGTATPTIHAGRIYTISSAGIVVCGDVATGAVVWKHRIPGAYSASPLIAGDRFYAVNEAGLTTVLKLGAEPAVLAENALEDVILASPAVAAGALYFRSDKALYAIGR